MNKRIALLLVLGVAAVTIAPIPAISVCHRFFFNPTTYTVNEGAGSVSVTVERDGTVAPSQVKISTVNDTAKAGQDFTGFQNQTVVFTTEKTKPVSISIINDTSFEVTESFKLHLSEPGNAPPPNAPCPNPGFIISPADDATVTIQDNDPAPATQPPPGGTSPKASPTATTQASPTPTADISPGSPVPLEEASPEETPKTAKEAQPTDEDGGAPTGLIVAAISILVAAGAGFGLWFLRRTPA